MTLVIQSHRYTYEYVFVDSCRDLLRAQPMISASIYVVDSKVFELHPVLQSLPIDLVKIVEVNSNTKNTESLFSLLNDFVERKLRKSSTVVVIGGATLQDLVATACCLYNRGIQWFFVPTTLLSQADSAIGSKTSIDCAGVKNKIGAFYPPKKIFASPQFLSTLTLEEVLSGIGDMLHYILPYQESCSLLESLSHCPLEADKLLSIFQASMPSVLLIKSELVSIDEFDNGPRNIFNFGHTFAHALEKSVDTYLPHGIAVMMGIIIALKYSESNAPTNLLVILQEQRNMLQSILDKSLQAIGKKYIFSESLLFKSLQNDKKNTVHGNFTAILPCVLEESLWNSSSFSPLYGLRAKQVELCDSVVQRLFSTIHSESVNFYPNAAMFLE